MFNYQSEQLKSLLSEIIRQNTDTAACEWLNEKATATGAAFNIAFVTTPRKTGKALINLSPDQFNAVQSARPEFSVQNWTIDRLARVWLLLNADPADKEKYFRGIENLFFAAEVNELVALYSALPLFAYPPTWVARCAEGIRNNIGDVLQSIMCNNPYPSENLDEAAWNQLVLKAFFTEKPIEQIIGLDRRSNQKLAKTLSDYAHERWAAHRTVNPQLWRCVGPFINEDILPDIKKIAASENPLEKEAAALACHQSGFLPAKELIPSPLNSAILSGRLNWDTLAEKTKDYVLQS